MKMWVFRDITWIDLLYLIKWNSDCVVKIVCIARYTRAEDFFQYGIKWWCARWNVLHVRTVFLSTGFGGSLALHLILISSLAELSFTWFNDVSECLIVCTNETPKMCCASGPPRSRFFYCNFLFCRSSACGSIEDKLMSVQRSSKVCDIIFFSATLLLRK